MLRIPSCCRSRKCAHTKAKMKVNFPPFPRCPNLSAPIFEIQATTFAVIFQTMLATPTHKPEEGKKTPRKRQGEQEKFKEIYILSRAGLGENCLSFFICLLVKRHIRRYGHPHLHQSTRPKGTQVEDMYTKLSVKHNVVCDNDGRLLMYE